MPKREEKEEHRHRHEGVMKRSQAARQDQRERRGCRGTMMLSTAEKRFTCKQKDMTTSALQLCALHPIRTAKCMCKTNYIQYVDIDYNRCTKSV